MHTCRRVEQTIPGRWQEKYFLTQLVLRLVEVAWLVSNHNARNFVLIRCIQALAASIGVGFAISVKEAQSPPGSCLSQKSGMASSRQCDWVTVTYKISTLAESKQSSILSHTLVWIHLHQTDILRQAWTKIYNVTCVSLLLSSFQFVQFIVYSPVLSRVQRIAAHWTIQYQRRRTPHP